MKMKTMVAMPTMMPMGAPSPQTSIPAWVLTWVSTMRNSRCRHSRLGCQPFPPRPKNMAMVTMERAMPMKRMVMVLVMEMAATMLANFRDLSRHPWHALISAECCLAQELITRTIAALQNAGSVQSSLPPAESEGMAIASVFGHLPWLSILTQSRILS